MTLPELILAMLEGFQGGEAWCQGSLCETSDVLNAPPALATRHCLLGMRNRMFRYQPGEAEWELWEQFERRFSQVTGLSCCRRSLSPIPGWNDSRQNFGEVKTVLERMLEEVK